jgi:hypothetical protein
MSTGNFPTLFYSSLFIGKWMMFLKRCGFAASQSAGCAVRTADKAIVDSAHGALYDIRGSNR